MQSMRCHNAVLTKSIEGVQCYEHILKELVKVTGMLNLNSVTWGAGECR